jgi:hypothetical protein
MTAMRQPALAQRLAAVAAAPVSMTMRSKAFAIVLLQIEVSG